jgi:hypothetical protein
VNLRKDHYHTDPRSFLTVNLSGCLLLLLGLNLVFGLGGVGFRLSTGGDWLSLARFQYNFITIILLRVRWVLAGCCHEQNLF